MKPEERYFIKTLTLILHQLLNLLYIAYFSEIQIMASPSNQRCTRISTLFEIHQLVKCTKQHASTVDLTYLSCKALVDREKMIAIPIPILGEIMIGDPYQDPYFKMDRDPDNFSDRL